MLSIWTLARFLHVMSAVIWVGGQLTLSFVVRPATAKTIDDATHQRLWTMIGAAFGRIATFVLIPVLLATGIGLAYHRGVTLAGLAHPGYQGTLTAKILLAFVSFGIVALHGAMAARSRSSRTLTVGGAVVSVSVILLAVSLVP